MSIKAIAHISQVRGGSQARIMLADDGKKYVVKFMGNPQSTRVLANDYLACRLARMIGLSVPEPVIILVDEETIFEQQITFTLAGRAVAVCPGLQFGSLVVTDEEVWDWPRHSMFGQVHNRGEFAGILAFDKWTGNADGRQVLFHRKLHQRKFRATYIDFGYCFNAGEWSFPDAPLRGVYAINEVYEEYPIVGRLCSLASADRALLRERTAVHCGGDPLRVVWRAIRTAATAELLVGAAQHGSPSSRRFQDLKQKPFSELDRGTSGTLRDRSQWRTQGHVRSAPLANPELVPRFGGKNEKCWPHQTRLLPVACRGSPKYPRLAGVLRALCGD